MFETEDFKLQERRGVAPAGNDPSLPSTAPKNVYVSKNNLNDDFGTSKKNLFGNFYDRDTKECCGRTCKSWACIIGYGFIYLLFLTTFTLVLLYISLFLLKELIEFRNFEPMALIYPESGVGLTAVPTSESNYPLIWYKYGEKDDFVKYVQAIDRLLLSGRTKRDLANLGPCGQPPYGYGDKPCVIIRINNHLHWSGKPLQLNSTEAELAPSEVKQWMMADKNRLWLQCSGYHTYDQEHIGSIEYFPDPPGFDPEVFPLSNDRKSPLVAIQISDFTVGISLAIECKLWYENGPSAIDFVLYVAPDDIVNFIGQTSINV